MSTVDELKEVLGSLKDDHNITSCAVVSRNGIPLAYELPAGSHVDAFSTLSATILGASEVIFSGIGKSEPERILIESNNGTYIAVGVGPKALLVAIADTDVTGLKDHINAAAGKIKEVLNHGK